VVVFLALMDDHYPSTDDRQSVHLDHAYPDATRDLNRWMPLVKWFLAIPHFIVLAFLSMSAVVAVVVAWCPSLDTARHGLRRPARQGQVPAVQSRRLTHHGGGARGHPRHGVPSARS